MKYSHSDSLLDGLYQLWLPNLVDSLQLRNGPYTYALQAKSITGVTYNAAKDMFVVSDVGNPNATTGTDGRYFFSYNDAFVGDSVTIYSNEIYPEYSVILGRNVTLLFERKGYYSRYYVTYLLQDISICSDMTMIRNNQ